MCEVIENAAWLVRAILPRELNAVTGEPTSFSFNSQELSVSCLLPETIRLLVNRADYSHLAGLSAAYCREIGLELVPDPTPDDPHHVLVMMATGRSSKARKLKEHAVLVTVGTDADLTYEALIDAIARFLDPSDEKV